MLAAYNATQKDKKPDAKQIEWKFELTKRLVEAGYTSEKSRQIFEFIRNSLKFDSEPSNELYEKKLETITKTPKNMGIGEAILEDVKEQAVEEAKIKGIQKALNQKKWTIDEIADVFEVSIDFVLKVQKGEIK
jgi:hypothetical protein